MLPKPRLDREDIGIATGLGGNSRRWIATGITIPDDPMEIVQCRVRYTLTEDYQTGLFRVAVLDALAPSVADTATSNGVQLTALGASAASGYFLGRTSDNELLVSGVATPRNGTVEMWTLRAEDVRVEDLADPAQARILPAPTVEQAGYIVTVNAAGDGFVYQKAVRAGGVGAVYATAAEYRVRTGAASESQDDLIDAELEAASRLIDHELRLMPGAFAPHTGVYTFQTNGGKILRLRDEAGLHYPLRSVVDGGIRPDYDREGTYTKYEWDLTDRWLWPIPRNGPALGIPYSEIEIRFVGVGARQTPYYNWPIFDGSVQIDGDWGWPVIPGAIRELTIHVARSFRDAISGGAAQRLETIDDAMTLRPDGWRLWLEVKTRYGSRGGPLEYLRTR